MRAYRHAFRLALWYVEMLGYNWVNSGVRDLPCNCGPLSFKKTFRAFYVRCI